MEDKKCLELPFEMLLDEFVDNNKKLCINLTENSSLFRQKLCHNARILKITSELSFGSSLAFLEKLQPEDFPYLFIFVINFKNISNSTESINKVTSNLLKFATDRPLIAQLSFDTGSEARLFYKNDSGEFMAINFVCQENHESLKNFPSFLSMLMSKNAEIFKEIIKGSPIEDSSLILRFLRTLKLDENYFKPLILKIAEKGTKTDLLTAIDAPFPDSEQPLTDSAQSYISEVFYDDNETSSHDSDDNSSDIDDSASNSHPSILHTAVTHKNKEIINFLISSQSNLIQQLPIRHQVKISTAAYESGQFDVVCDLLEIADFPFYENFDQDSVDDDRLCNLVKDRLYFIEAIKNKNLRTISRHIEANRNLKFGYNFNNISAIMQAVSLKHFDVYSHLKSLGLQAVEFDDLAEVLNNEELREAYKHVKQQRQKNVFDSIVDDHNAVNLLCTRSRIHNKRAANDRNPEYMKKIREWYLDIMKIEYGAEFLNAVASCQSLKIVFDFESDTVDSSSLGEQNASGSTYTISKQIFIGAKLSDKKREQQIKGVLAHELCHYLMKLVYENQENPYYEVRKDKKKMFKKIVKKIDMWSVKNSKEPDDECCGVISSVFKLYPAESFHQELIVRAIQMLVQFADSEEASKHLQEKYKILFDFWYYQVMPDILNFNLNARESVKEVNKDMEVIAGIRGTKLALNSSKYLEFMSTNSLTIVSTKFPSLFLQDILNHLHNDCGSLLDTQNLFIDPEKLQLPKFDANFSQILELKPKLRIFVDCTRSIDCNFDDIFFSDSSNLIFIVKDESHSKLLSKMLKKYKKIGIKHKTVSYDWSDLGSKTQEQLLHTSVTFNGTKVALHELIGWEDAGNIIDCQLLALLLDKSTISINEGQDDHQDILFWSLRFTKIRKVSNNQSLSKDQLLNDSRSKTYVLIQDQDKTVALKNFSNFLRTKYPKKWITYIDLRLFVHQLNACQSDFCAFMIDKILQPISNFEAKIFQKFYNDGKVLVLFDGFDDISAGCAEFVTQLAQNFQQNGGNQLWIETLMGKLDKKLENAVVYSLDELNEEDWVDYVAASRVLMDMSGSDVIKAADDIVKLVKSSPKFAKYVGRVKQVVEAFPVRNLIGIQQLAVILADDGQEDNKRSKFYDKIAQFLSTGSDNFWKFHEYQAVKNLYPEFVDLLFFGYEGSDFDGSEAGVMAVKDGKLEFLDVSVEHFFVAKFIKSNLNEGKITGHFCRFLAQILSKGGNVRIFLNDLVGSPEELEKVQPELLKHIKEFYEFEDFWSIFADNLVNLVDFVINILKTGEYCNVKAILYQNAWTISSKSLEIFVKFQEFLFKFLNVADLRLLISEQEVIFGVIKSGINDQITSNLIAEIAAKTDRKFIQKLLTSKSRFYGINSNIFYFLSLSENFTAEKFKNLLEIMQNYLQIADIFELMLVCDADRKSIFHIFVAQKNSENLKIFWTEIEIFFNSTKFAKNLKNLINFNYNVGLQVLHKSTGCDKFEFHKVLWEILVKTLQNREELLNFLTLKSKKNQNFVHFLVQNCQNPAVVNFYLESLKNIFGIPKFNEILKSKGFLDMNLLQSAAYLQKNVQVHENLWKIIQNSFQDVKDLKHFLNQLDNHSHNILHIAAGRSPSDVFEFIISELQIHISSGGINKMFNSRNKWNQNILQIATGGNESTAFHEYLWISLRKHLSYTEISKIVKHFDNLDRDAFQNAVANNTIEVVCLTWNEVCKFISCEAQKEYLKKYGNVLNEISMLNITQSSEEVQMFVQYLVN